MIVEQLVHHTVLNRSGEAETDSPDIRLTAPFLRDTHS